MGHQIVDARVPADLADELIADGLAQFTTERRSSVLTILTDGTSIAAVTISLLQGPSTIAQVSKSIKRWFLERRRGTTDPGTLIIVFKDVTLNFDGDSETNIVAAITSVLRDAMLPRNTPQPPDGGIGDFTI
jgi:hypothetical protein